jgi:hypothetical protein
VVEGKIERNRAATRVAHEVCPIDRQVIEQMEQVARVGIWDVFGLGLAEAALVVAHDRVAIVQGRDLGVPHAQVRDAGVNQRQGRAFAVELVIQLRARVHDVARFAPGH